MIDAPSVGVTDGASRVVWGRRITLSEREVHGKGTSELFASEQLLLEKELAFPTAIGSSYRKANTRLWGGSTGEVGLAPDLTDRRL